MLLVEPELEVPVLRREARLVWDCNYCYDFADGNCPRGNDCTFDHLTEAQAKAKAKNKPKPPKGGGKGKPASVAVLSTPGAVIEEVADACEACGISLTQPSK